jgi:hypothetical protein
MPLTQLVGHRPQFGVRQSPEVVLDRVDLADDSPELAQRLAFASAKETVNDDWHFAVALPADLLA